MTRVVERSDLEAMHARVRAEAPGGSHGLFGPGSVTWDVGAEGICLAAGGRAALMQVALPAVAKSIVEHSAVRHGDVAGRFQRTFANVYAMIFGRLDDALAAARHVWGVHRRIVGEGYHANDPDSLMWVHATLVDSAVVAHETFLAPLSMRRKRAHYEETKRFAWLFGIPDDVIPPDWDAFQRYMRAHLDGTTLAVGPEARTVRAGLFQAKTPALRPLWASYEIITAALLPSRLRQEFGFSWRRRDRAAWRVLRRGLSTAYPRTPARLRWSPAYLDARRRIAGRPGRDLVGRCRERLVLSLL